MLVGHLVTRASLPGADPDAGSWLVTLVLFAAGVAAWAVVWAAGTADRRARVFWPAVGITALALAVNKQLDAQEYLVEGAAAGLLDPVVGWLKGAAAGVVVLGLLLCAAVSTMALVWATSGLARFRMAMAGVLVLVLVALLRTAEIVRLGPVSVRLDHDTALPFELAGAVLLLVAATRERWLYRRSRGEGKAVHAAP